MHCKQSAIWQIDLIRFACGSAGSDFEAMCRDR